MGKYAKMVVAAIGAALIALQTALGDNTVDPQDWVTIAISALATLGVGVVPNAEKSDPR